MSHTQKSGPPPAPAGDAGLVATVLHWLIPGALIAICAVLCRGISHHGEDAGPGPAAVEQVAVSGEMPIGAELDDRLTVDLYDVTDLVPAGSALAPNRDGCQELVNLIESSVEPDTWGALSGPGQISPMRLEDSRLL